MPFEKRSYSLEIDNFSTETVKNVVVCYMLTLLLVIFKTCLAHDEVI